MRSRREFEEVVRRGARAKSGAVMVYRARATDDGSDGGATRIGLIVNRKVGGSVARHKVSRVLRHAVGPLVAQLPTGSLVVIRALPSAGGAGFSACAKDLETCLRRLGEDQVSERRT